MRECNLICGLPKMCDEAQVDSTEPVQCSVLRGNKADAVDTRMYFLGRFQ